MNAPKKTSIMIFAASIVMLANFPGFAQESFKLSDYKNPDYTYRALDFEFNLDGHNSLHKEIFNNDLSNSRAHTWFNASLNPTYNARKNTARYQGFQTARLGIAPRWSHYRKTDESPVFQEYKTKGGGSSFDFSAQSTNRFYNQKQQFVELGFNLQSEFGFGKTKKESLPTSYPFNYKTISLGSLFSIGIPVAVGMGRIEEVQDARLAVYILEDLEKSGDLTRTPDADEILELAHFITSIKNKRYFDQRLRHISEITAVDSLLDAMGLKAKSGASYYTLLNDNWSHSAGPVRSSGSRLSFGFSPSFRFQPSKHMAYFNDSIANQSQLSDYKNELRETRTITGLQLYAQYALEKPINLYWQNSTFFSAGYSIWKEEDKTKSIANEVVIKDETIEVTDGRLYISASNTVGYYPNSRTSIRLNARASYFHNFFDYPEDDNEAYSFSPSSISAGISALADYYVSPRMRINITLQSQANFRTEKSKSVGPIEELKVKRNSLQTYLTAGFVYSIF
jgi:hypothetical protein